jgi:hypothetical protein
MTRPASEGSAALGIIRFPDRHHTDGRSPGGSSLSCAMPEDLAQPMDRGSARPCCKRRRAQPRSARAGTFLQDLLDDRYGRKHIRPTGVEGQVYEYLRGLRLRQAIFHRPVEVIRDLRNLAGGDESTDGHQAPVSRRQGRTSPQVMEQDVAGVLHETRSHRADIVLNAGRALRLGGLINGKQRT